MRGGTLWPQVLPMTTKSMSFSLASIDTEFPRPGRSHTGQLGDVFGFASCLLLPWRIYPVQNLSHIVPSLILDFVLGHIIVVVTTVIPAVY